MSQMDGRWEDPDEIAKDKRRLAQKLSLIVRETARAYESDRAEEDVRNLAYYRGKFWRGDGVVTSRRVSDYKAAQNAVFPILDTLASSLAMELPQVELLDQRVSTSTDWTRDTDPTISGKRVAAILNAMAEDADLDEVTHEWVLQALIFRKAVVMTSWSAELGSVVWENLLPWEVFFDPNARSAKNAAWAFRYVSVHWSAWKRGLNAGVYTRQEGAKHIRPDRYPRSLVDKSTVADMDTYEERLRRSGLKEYVGIVEFWDFRTGMLYHLHVETQQILMAVSQPYQRPFEVLVFHTGVGRIDGVSDVGLMAPVQRDINELTSARKEIVHRLVRRMLYDKALFPNDSDFDRFMKSKSWEPVGVEVGAMKNLAESIYVTPEMDTTYAFDRHLAGNMEGIRRIAGEGDYQRGQQKNFRTAAEFDGVRASIEGRLNTRMKRLSKGVTRLFRKGLEVLQWGVRNAQYSNIDLEGLLFETQADVGAEVLVGDILHQAPRFRLLPFSPLMEDRVARRRQLVELGEMLLKLPQEEHLVEWREYLRAVVDMYGLPPTLVKSIEEAAGEAEAALKAAEGAGGAPANMPGPAPITSGAPLPFPGMPQQG